MEQTSTATRQAGIRNGEGHDEEQEHKNRVELPKTAEELQQLLQSEADRRVTQALKTAYEKWRQEHLLRLQEEREEAERLIRMSTEEREKEVLERYRKEIEDKERALKQKELEIKTIGFLAEKGLPIEFKEFLAGSDEQSTLKRVADFSRLWQIKLDAAVKLALSGLKLNE